MPLGGAATAAGVGALGSLASGLIGGSSASGNVDAANAATQAGLQAWLNVNVPDPAQQQLELQQYQQTGSFSPTVQQAFQQDPTGMASLNVNPTGQDAEMSALSKMQSLANAGGMDAQAQATQQQAQNTAQAAEQGQRGAIVQNMAARGMGGASGAGLAAELQASQGDQDQAAMTGTQAASDAEQRALQAMQGASATGSNLYSQDYGQAAAAAQAQDAINKFNTQNSQQVAASNAAAQTAAQAANTNLTQGISEQNTQLANQQQQYNKGLLQQQFNNQATVAGGVAGQDKNVATQQTADANRTAGEWSGIGTAIAGAGGSVAQGLNKANSGTGSTSGSTSGNGYVSSTAQPGDEDSYSGSGT